MGNEVAAKAQQPIAVLRELLEKSRGEFARALPKHMTTDRLIRVALTAAQKTPALLECDVKSVVKSVMESAQLGLEPDGMLGMAYLIPFRDGRSGKMLCQLIPGYKGLIALAYRSGQVKSIHAEAVYAEDVFEFEHGLDEKLRHIPNFDVEDRGALRCVYAVAHMKDGGHNYVVLPLSEVQKTRKKSKSGNSGPWVSDFEAMAVKTAIRRLAKYLPQCPELQQAVAVEEAREVEDIDVTDDLPTPSETLKPRQSKAARLAAQLHDRNEAPADAEGGEEFPPEPAENAQGGFGE